MTESDDDDDEDDEEEEDEELQEAKREQQYRKRAAAMQGACTPATTVQRPYKCHLLDSLIKSKHKGA